MDEEVTKTISKLSLNKTILYPTDTVWGLGCDATDEEAVSKIFKLKNRSESKSLVVLVSSLEMLRTYVQDIPETIIQFITTTEKPTTIIYNKPKGLASNVVSSDDTVAIRIPKHVFCVELIHQYGKPIVSTSANISGDATPLLFSEISQPILEGVDYIVNLEQDKIANKSSTILKLTGDTLEVVRP